MNGMNSRRGGETTFSGYVVRSVQHDETHLGLSLKMYTALASASEMGPRLSECCSPQMEATGVCTWDPAGTQGLCRWA